MCNSYVASPPSVGGTICSFLLLQQSRRKKSKAKQKKGKQEGELKEDEECSGGSEKPKPPGNSQENPGPDVWRLSLDESRAVPANEHLSLHTLGWKRTSSSDSEYSDAECGMQSKTRFVIASRQRPAHHLFLSSCLIVLSVFLFGTRSFQATVRQGALSCFLSTVKSIEKKVLYGYWPAFVPDTPGIGSPQSLSLMTIALKDPSPKVRVFSGRRGSSSYFTFSFPWPLSPLRHTRVPSKLWRLVALKL